MELMDFPRSQQQLVQQQPKQLKNLFQYECDKIGIEITVKYNLTGNPLSLTHTIK